MKVWELIAILAKCPAGSEVVVSRGQGTYVVPLEAVDTNCADDTIWLYGDGSDDFSDEQSE